ncbi:MAG: glycosyltransferase [Bacteroidetes bacterium]|nr:glycosyltransferase [Bacteroidota bacterium]
MFWVVNDGSKDIVTKMDYNNSKSITRIFITNYFTFAKPWIWRCFEKRNTASKQSIVTMDADGQHRMEDLPKLYQRMKLEGADLCIGNRNFKGSSFQEML